jgi:hypothetical protein
MPAQFANEGLVQMNKAAFNIGAQFNYSMIPYTNNPTLGPTNAYATFTQCTLTGAGPTVLIPLSWVTSVTGGVWSAAYPTITLTFAAYGGSPVTIYGIMVYDSTNSKLLWAQNLPLPVVIPLAGGVLTVTLQYSDGACPV